MWLFVCRSAPTRSLAVRELVDMIMMAAVFGHDSRVLLLGDGEWNLAPGCNSPLAELDGLLSTPCIVKAPGPQDSRLPVQPLEEDAIRALFRDSARVVML